MEEIDLKELLKIFWIKKLQIILIILIFMGIGVIYTVGFKVPLYSAETTLILASQNSNQSNSNTITTSTATDRHNSKFKISINIQRTSKK